MIYTADFFKHIRMKEIYGCGLVLNWNNKYEILQPVLGEVVWHYDKYATALHLINPEFIFFNKWQKKCEAISAKHLIFADTADKALSTLPSTIRTELEEQTNAYECTKCKLESIGEIAQKYEIEGV